MSRRRTQPVAAVDRELVPVYVLTWLFSRGIELLYAPVDPETGRVATFCGPRGGWVREGDIFLREDEARDEAHRRLSSKIRSLEGKLSILRRIRRKPMARPGFESHART